jgi:hypothetical protein
MGAADGCFSPLVAAGKLSMADASCLPAAAQEIPMNWDDASFFNQRAHQREENR